MVAAGALPLPAGFEGPLRLMAVAHGLTVRADLSEAPSGTAAQARAAHLAAVPDGTGDPGSLVIGIGDGGFAPAACHAAAKRGRLLLAESPKEAVERVEKVLAEEPLPRSMTFVGVGSVFGPATVRRLHGLATRDGVPWGVLTGRDASGVAWHVAKQWLSGGRGGGRHLLLHPHDEPPAGPPPDGPVRGLYRSEITPDVLLDVGRSAYDLVTVTGHGDQADVYAYAGRLCSRTGPRTQVGRGLMRCFAEDGCYRNEISAAADGLDAADLVLVPADRVPARVLLLNTCAGLLVAPGYRYDLESSLLVRCLEGATTAVVTVETPRRPEPGENMLFSALLATGDTVGRAALRLNRLQESHFTGAPVFILFGDPDLRVTVDDAVPAVLPSDGADTLRLPVTGGHAVRARLTEATSAWLDEAGDRARVELVEGPPGARAFVIPASTGHELVVVTDRGTLGGTAVSLRAADRLVPVGALRGLQRDLRALALLSCPPSDPRVADAVALALRAHDLPSGSSLKAAAERRAVNVLRDELLMYQAAAVGGWVTAWNDALGGEMLSIREDRALYGAYEPVEAACPNCAAPLYRVPVADQYEPDAARELWMCSSCTVVADLPEGGPPLAVSAPGTVVRGRPYRLRIELPGRRGVAVAGAAILGARGRARSALLPVPDGVPAAVLTLPVGEGMVPGVYTLRVVVMENLRCRFHSTPISVLTGGLTEGLTGA